jgi:hypothetical protein
MSFWSFFLGTFLASERADSHFMYTYLIFYGAKYQGANGVCVLQIKEGGSLPKVKGVRDIGNPTHRALNFWILSTYEEIRKATS